MTARPLSVPLSRMLVAVSLGVTAVLSVASVILAPDLPADFADRIRSIGDAGVTATASAVTFTLAQLPFLVAVVGIGAMLRQSTPRLAAAGATLAVLGGFGHTVFGGIALVQLAMADDLANAAVHGEVLERVESSVAVVFMALGLLGTVLGLLLLSIGLWRAQAVPRWIPATIWAFLVVEFVGSGLSETAAYVASLCYLVAFGGLAAGVLRADVERPVEAPV